jgi:plastocyanin
MSHTFLSSRALAPAIAAAAVLAGCGSSSPASTGSSSPAGTGSSSPASAGSSSPGVAAPSKLSIAISGYTFAPATVTVESGARVTFANRDSTAHTATAQGQAFDTGTLKQGHSASVVLSQPGTYTYYCVFHAFMRATLIVVR